MTGGRVGERKAELPVTQKLLDRIVQSTQHLVLLETANVGDTVAQMRMLAMRGGTSVYVWDPESGIASLRESGLNVIPADNLSDAAEKIVKAVKG